MNQKLTNWQQELDDEAVEEYNALRRSLQRNAGFGLFFVQCSPATGENIITEISKDISHKKIEVLRLTKPIDSLYNNIIDLPNIENIDILFISGLEHSLYQYEDKAFGNSSQETYLASKERYTQSWRGIPRFLGYLNLQRDRFREDFDISFVFILPSFGIDYFIKRAPDFFDWRSGLFKFVPRKDNLTAIDFDGIFQANSEQSIHELLEIKALTKQLEFSNNEQANLAYKQFLLSMHCEKYEDAITYIDSFLKLNQYNDIAWCNRGISLANLGRFKEAVDSYNQALEINPDDNLAWYNRGISLANLGRDEEAVASFDKAVELNPDFYLAWYNHGIALRNLGRDEESVDSYDKAVKLNSDFYLAWNNHGAALAKLGRLKEAVTSWEQALKLKPDDYKAWYNRGIALDDLDRLEEAISSYKKVLELNPDFYQALYNLGVALAKRGRVEEAISTYKKVLGINPYKDEAWYNRACFFALQNQIQSAIEDLAKAISFNKEYQEMAKTDTDFDNIRKDTRFQSLINS